MTTNTPAGDAPTACPFCGAVGLDFGEGSAFRWITAACTGCGATTGETRVQTFGQGTREEWMAEAKRDAIAAWNRRASLSPASVGAEGWTDLPALPEAQSPVLLDIGRKFPIRAMWVAAKTLPAGCDDDDFGEYDEADDEWYCAAGWYECNEHEERHWSVSAKPLRWMRMPTPGTAASTPSPAAAVGGGGEADADEDYYVIQQLGHLLAEIAVIIKGPERARHRHGYADLPALVMELMAFKQAVLDPENQPSQFGTVLADLDACAKDASRLDWLRENTCDLRCIDVPTGDGDGDVDWIVIEHHMAKPHEREIGRSYSDDPRAAIDAARAAQQGVEHADQA